MATANVAPYTAVFCVNLFVDGVKYSLTDTVIGFWFVDVLTGKRYLFATIRKRLVCDCGCKGWCTFYVMFRFIRWTLEAMGAGVYPDHRDDASPWGVDTFRAELANTPMKTLLH